MSTTSHSPDCLLCGHCCGSYFALYVEEADERRWEQEGRQDILDRLEWERRRVTWDEDGAYNMDTGERFTSCVFLIRRPEGKFFCSIHATKPGICQDYPPGSSEICALYTRIESPPAGC